MVMSEKPILTALETSRLLEVDPKTLRKWVKEGNCPVPPINGVRPPRWRRADVLAWVGSASE